MTNKERFLYLFEMHTKAMLSGIFVMADTVEKATKQIVQGMTDRIEAKKDLNMSRAILQPTLDFLHLSRMSKDINALVYTYVNDDPVDVDQEELTECIDSAPEGFVEKFPNEVTVMAGRRCYGCGKPMSVYCFRLFVCHQCEKEMHG